MHIFNSRWHELTNDHIEWLFKAHLSEVTAFPYNLLPELRRLNVATLQVVEDRGMSTIYLIRETGNYYQLSKSGRLTGPIYFNEWVSSGKSQGVKTSYKIKTPPFIISGAGENSFLERLKEPKFRAKYNPSTKEIFDIEWENGEPNQITLINTLKKSAMFLKEKVK